MVTLLDQSLSIDYFGTSQMVIEDEALLNWARLKNISPANAQLEALGEGVIPLRYLKNRTALKLAEQERICRSRVLVCGCGGLGGIVINLLARVGVGNIRMVDHDVFAPSNLNRQLLSETNNLGRSKSSIAAERVRAINPLIEAEGYDCMIQQENVAALLQNMDLVLDALDNLPTRFMLADSAKTQRIPFIHAAVAGWWGQISTFFADSPLHFRTIYGERRTRDTAEESVGVLGPTAAVIGSLEALEAVRILSGGTPAYRDKLLYFDGESGRTEVLDLRIASSIEKEMT